MNPLFFLVLVGGGIYYYDKKQKEKKKLAAAADSTPKCDSTISRRGFILLCDGTTCKGAISDLTYVKNNDDDQMALDSVMRHASMVLGPKPWNPTLEQTRTVMNHIMGEVFPECNWAALPDSAPLGNFSIGQAAVMMQPALVALGQTGGGPPPGPGPGPVGNPWGYSTRRYL